jgi:hypothetical protein
MESRDKGKRREDECSRCERRNVDGLPREADLTPKLRSVECSDLYFRIQGGMIYFATGISDEKGQTVDFFCESEGTARFIYGSLYFSLLWQLFPLDEKQLGIQKKV